MELFKMNKFYFTGKLFKKLYLYDSDINQISEITKKYKGK